MELDDDVAAQFVTISWALNQLAQRVGQIDASAWRRSMSVKADDAVKRLEEEFSAWQRDQLRADPLNPLLFIADHYNVIRTIHAAQLVAVRHAGGRAGTPMYMRVIERSLLMPHRAAIAIIWRDRLSVEQVQALTAQARAAGIHVEDLL